MTRVRRGIVLALAVMMAASGAAAQDWRAAGVAAFEAAWLTVNDTFYDPAFGGLDWAAIRAELRPRVERAASADEQREIIRGMLGRLKQSHFALLSNAPAREATKGPASPPVDVRVVGTRVLVTRIHGNSGPVRAGDVILAIDDQAVSDIIGDVPDDDPRRAELSWRLVTRALSGGEQEMARLRVEHPGGDVSDLLVPRVVWPGELVTMGNLPTMRVHLETEEHNTPEGARVGVIRFSLWMAAAADPIAEAVDRFRSHDGIVIDLRGNTGGLADMIRGVAGHFLQEPVVLGRMRMRGLDLEFRANPRRSTPDGRSVVPYAGPVAIVVDNMTASASECFAGALQGLGRARVFGTRTSGQALPAATQQLVTGDVLLYGVGDFVTSTGQRLEGTGVVPDVEVPLEPARLAAGQDAIQAAVAWIGATAAERRTSSPK